MSRLVYLLLLLSPLAGVAEAVEEQALQPGMVNPGYHDQPAWFKQSFLDIREDVAEAAENHKRILLYFYQDGCPYCAKFLETNFGQPTVVEPTRRYFDVIAINMWGDREVTGFGGKNMTEKQFAADLKIMFTPTLVFLNEQGEGLMRLNGYYPPNKFAAVVDYVGRHQETELTFQDYLAKASSVASSGELHSDPNYLKPPYRLAERTGGKPLLVLFEQPDCIQCSELHNDILKRKESAALLDQFDVVLLNMWATTPVQTPDGKQTTAADWSRSLHIQYAPSIVMFDTSGKEAFRTEAYLKAFHLQSSIDYVLSGAYRDQPDFQRYVQKRADTLEAQGAHIDLME